MSPGPGTGFVEFPGGRRLRALVVVLLPELADKRQGKKGEGEAEAALVGGRHAWVERQAGVNVAGRMLGHTEEDTMCMHLPCTATTFSRN